MEKSYEISELFEIIKKLELKEKTSNDLNFYSLYFEQQKKLQELETTLNQHSRTISFLSFPRFS
jgi:hypothetical protein